jgi:hypothetical protein
VGFLDRATKAPAPSPDQAAPAPKRISLSARFGQTEVALPLELILSENGPACRRAVQDSKDLRRIEELPRRPALLKEELATARTALESALSMPGNDRHLFDIQTWGLYEFPQANGGMGPIGVGHGKTLLDMLLPMVFTPPEGRDHVRAVLFIPPNMRAAFFKEWEAEAKRWKLPNLAGGSKFITGRPMLHVISYSEISLAKNTDLLNRIEPDLVIADEAHNLRDRKSSRTKRFLRYFADHPECRLVALSGTLTTKSLKDYAHLSEHALGNRSPLPIHWPTVEEWAGLLDPTPKSGLRTSIGAFRRLCDVGEHARQGFRRRLVETEGVVATTEGALAASLVLSEREVAVPGQVMDMLEELRGPDSADDDGDQHGTWRRPDGEELLTGIEVANAGRQMGAGLYLRWRYPRGEPIELIEEWFFKRQDWNKELRKKLKTGREFMDSPLLCTNAAIRFWDGYQVKDGEEPLPVWHSEHWPKWREIRDRVQHETQPVWVDDFLARDAAKWATEHVGIVWSHNDAFGKRVAELAGITYYGGGAEASATIINESGKRSVVASISAHGTGKNLQKFSKMLFAQMPSGGGAMEQALGRCHRTGQEADEVVAFFYRHTKEYRNALVKATQEAAYISETMGTKQKLLYATRTWEED